MGVRRALLVMGVCVLAGCIVFSSDCFARDKEKEKGVTLTGVVSATKDKKGKPDVVKLTVGTTVYQVNLDALAKDLADELDGKTAEVEGDLVTKKGETVLHVKDFSAVVVGAVDVTKDHKGKAKEAKLKAGAQVYDIAMDAKGQELAEQMDGATVKVIGKLDTKKEHKEKVGEITVRNYSISGTVSVQKNRRDKKVTGAQLTVGATVYNIEFDDTGKSLGETMDGRKVDVEGVIVKKGDKKDDLWLKVAKFNATP